MAVTGVMVAAMPNPRVISVSRRSDIPALHAAWLRGRIAAGWVAYANPYNRRPIVVSLAPDAVRALVFWTRNPHPLIALLPELEARYARRHYLHLTVTGMDRRIEERTPAVAAAVAAAATLAERYGPDYVWWRFDPILVSAGTPVEEVLDRFGRLCRLLQGVTTRCTVSFLDGYRSALANLAQAGIVPDPAYFSGASDPTRQVQMLTRLHAIASAHGIALQTCTEDAVGAAVPGVVASRCIDPVVIERIAPGFPLPSSPSRPGCGCAVSADIGTYDSCSHGCRYCYATRSPSVGRANAQRYRADGFPLDHLPEGDPQ
ncbi:MAG: DUF1848 family protein [Candidatus Viridilinea halotolerans]|uniref:DUF1848 family protein n=1 Tax=Candidatus Viridilinea halotolerans TaxID=2491704 RepID=A0A426TRE7_9CHLR|nr:MAG: DUF1848 family protein [Candidatus Viridilinea halotolerans]